MFGAGLEDLDPIQYGYLSLEGLLAVHSELVTLTRLADDTVWCSSPLMALSDVNSLRDKVFLRLLLFPSL